MANILVVNYLIKYTELERDIMKSQMVSIRSAKNVYDFYQKTNRIHFISDQILILIWTKLVGLTQMIVQAKVETKIWESYF